MPLTARLDFYLENRTIPLKPCILQLSWWGSVQLFQCFLLNKEIKGVSTKPPLENEVIKEKLKNKNKNKKLSNFYFKMQTLKKKLAGNNDIRQQSAFCDVLPNIFQKQNFKTYNTPP